MENNNISAESYTPLLAAQYRFSSTLTDEYSGRCKRYIREVSINQLNASSEETRFRLLCKKYTFDDPQITPIIRRTAYVFDILIVRVNLQGRITAVENQTEIQKKWEQLKQILRKDHAGDAFDNYLERVDLTLYTTENLISFLESDKMYGLFFTGLRILNTKEEGNPQYVVRQVDNTTRWIGRTNDPTCSEQYLFRGENLSDCFKITNLIQHELLCLCLKKN